MLSSNRDDAVSIALTKPLGDRAVIIYHVPDDQVGTYLEPLGEIGPGTWLGLKEPLPGNLMRRVDYLAESP